MNHTGVPIEHGTAGTSKTGGFIGLGLAVGIATFAAAVWFIIKVRRKREEPPGYTPNAQDNARCNWFVRLIGSRGPRRRTGDVGDGAAAGGNENGGQGGDSHVSDRTSYEMGDLGGQPSRTPVRPAGQAGKDPSPPYTQKPGPSDIRSREVDAINEESRRVRMEQLQRELPSEESPRPTPPTTPPAEF